jgi:hypothetical protein
MLALALPAAAAAAAAAALAALLPPVEGGAAPSALSGPCVRVTAAAAAAAVQQTVALSAHLSGVGGGGQHTHAPAVHTRPPHDRNTPPQPTRRHLQQRQPP